MSLDATYFDIRNFKKAALNSNKENDNKLIPLFKILSPVHLLKLSFANDSNSLQPKFYSELLHIIGLYEYKDGSKKLIGRKKEGERNVGSLLENAINNLDSHDKILRLNNASIYGEKYQEQLYNIALELVITWINRILFLKLLEAQLLNYHKGEKAYTFLNKDKIRDFDDLDKLFFRVLAKKTTERSADTVKLFGNVPYLNSSLFEPTELETATIAINGLDNRTELPILSSTILKDYGKTRKGSLNTIDYLFDFLNAYDFSSEGAEEIQEDNKPLINASVLGLIFEKINGYKDGSFFTPGFITMYMCRETIRRAVVQKFNDTKGWELKEYGELYNKIRDDSNRKEANTVINSLKICDPAVGSGHFLVSALNELIAIKSDLNILISSDGRTLNDYHIVVVNDELIVTDENKDPFKYNFHDARSQTVQQTLFHEKQTIIENCLFGVDINPNSVKICRLRLWIELLKNAYYKPAVSGSLELETLPNIDINIKTGNSLISRFALDADLKQLLKKSSKIQDYKNAISRYQNAKSKVEKREVEQFIVNIKNEFRKEISSNSTDVIKLNKVEKEYNFKYQSSQLFDVDLSKDQVRNKQKLAADIENYKTAIEDFKSNKIYENAFEWRFEFPEVLSDEGDSVGFDVVIGNPPYFSNSTFNSSLQNFLKDTYETFSKGSDIYCLFYEIGFNLLRKGCNLCFITSNRFCFTNYGIDLRSYLSKKDIIQLIDFNGVNVFENANVGSIIINVTDSIASKAYLKVLGYRLKHSTSNLSETFLNDYQSISRSYFLKNQWSFEQDLTQSLKVKIESKGIPFINYSGISINRGITTGLNHVFVISKDKRDELINLDNKSDEILLPVLKGANIKKYRIIPPTQYLVYTYTDIEISKFPAVYNYLLKYKKELSEVFEAKNGSKKWYELRKCSYYNKFFKTKLVWTRLSSNNAFAISDNKEFTVDSSSFAVSKDVKYLAAILNSRVVLFYFKLGSVIWGKDGIKWFGKFFDNIPIPIPSLEEKHFLEVLVDQILEQKLMNADTLPLESQIDQLVYQLYNLTEEEIKIVEGGV